MTFGEEARNIGYFINLNLLNIQKASLRDDPEEKICQMIFMFIGDNMHHCNEEIKDQLQKEIDDINIFKNLNIKSLLKWHKLKFILLSDENIKNYRAEALIQPEALL